MGYAKGLAATFSTQFARIWRRYELQLQKHPLRTQMMTTGCIYMFGDTVAQNLEQQQSLNKQRLTRTVIYASCVEAPMGHYWYHYLDVFLTKKFLSGSFQLIGSKLLADTLLMGPVHVALFFAFMKFGEGGGFKEIKDKLSVDFVPTFTAECGFWIPYQTINFWQIPVRHQLLFVNMGVLIESIFLCWAQSQQDWWSTAKEWVQQNMQ
eukprot:TRINITY_DN9816_c0_g3_i2.p1 TRINITY_DN9816_c0_g3~~TRINITY_DN9816_c0_g3_i2.p1  ORF type:complete len:208 (-),score=9.79 TRINITY_DN9816_c0_g3_i2:238-861(-)